MSPPGTELGILSVNCKPYIKKNKTSFKKLTKIVEAELKGLSTV